MCVNLNAELETSADQFSHAYDQSSLEEFNVPLHELEQLILKFADNEVILKIDANTKVFSFEDG